MFSSEIRQNLWNGLALTALAIVFLTVGFFFGYRLRDSQASADKLNTSLYSKQSDSASSQSVSVIPVEGVSFIKVNQPPECPTSHSVKGVFDANLGYYYTQSNKSYDRVNPDICFASEEFARDIAGFVKKF